MTSFAQILPDLSVLLVEFVYKLVTLCEGPKLDRTTIPEKIPRTLFGYSEFDSDVKVKSVHCGVHGQGNQCDQIV